MPTTRRLRPHHYENPTLTVTSSAPPEVSLAALVAALVAARYEVLEQRPGRARLRAGSWLRRQIADSLDVQLLPRLATWGFRATVDLDALDALDVGDPEAPARVRVRMHRVSEHRQAVPHTLAAVEAAAARLRAGGHRVEVSEVEGS